MLRIATRGSALARWQASEVARLLRLVDPTLDVSLVVVSTLGDRRADVDIAALGGQGLFVKEVQAALLDGRADLAVHSAKDLPSTTTAGLYLAAVPRRGDPRDALVGASLSALGVGATVATGSVRRRAQLAGLRPDLAFVGLRGNIATRLDRCPPGGAVVVAAAALDRLGLHARAAEILEPSVMLPQVGQGAMAVECRADDWTAGGSVGGSAGRSVGLPRLMEGIDDPDSHLAVLVERGFLARLGGGCDLPVGAWAFVAGVIVHLEGLIASADGHVVIRRARHGPVDDPGAFGAALADELLVEAGGAAVLGIDSGPEGPGPAGGPR